MYGGPKSAVRPSVSVCSPGHQPPGGSDASGVRQAVG